MRAAIVRISSAADRLSNLTQLHENRVIFSKLGGLESSCSTVARLEASSILDGLVQEWANNAFRCGLSNVRFTIAAGALLHLISHIDELI